MSVCVVTGSSGLIGSQTVRGFAAEGMKVVGIDNDMRRYFFGEEASTEWNARHLQQDVPGYRHVDCDIRDLNAIDKLFREYGRDIAVVVHTAAQPSHDWAAREPLTDFSINANGTLHLLESLRKHAPDAVFIFTSTNKVYGDRPNQLPLIEEETRWELDANHPTYGGIDETMSIDQSKHSLFGASKVAADVLVQEYGRYFGTKTACFRGGCLTGPKHSGAQLHGFLAYLMKCAATGAPYTIFGYKGKQVRDNIHSEDLVEAFLHFFRDPRSGEVYNIGGGRERSCSVLEAITLCEEITGRKMDFTVSDEARSGDHQWYITDLTRFSSHYPQWSQRFTLKDTLEQIYHENADKWKK